MPSSFIVFEPAPLVLPAAEPDADADDDADELVVLAPSSTVVVVVGPVDIRLPVTKPANPFEGEQMQPPFMLAALEPAAMLPLKPLFPFPVKPDGVVGVVLPPAPPLRVGFIVVE